MSGLCCGIGLSLSCLWLERARGYVHHELCFNFRFLSGFEDTGEGLEAYHRKILQNFRFSLTASLSSCHPLPMTCWSCWSHWDVAGLWSKRGYLRVRTYYSKGPVLSPVTHFTLPILSGMFTVLSTLKYTFTNRWNGSCFWSISIKYEGKLAKCSSVVEHMPSMYKVLVPSPVP